jgi:dCTP deaminase
MILPAQMIRARKGMITPFVERYVASGMTYGLSSAGYDIRIAAGQMIAAGGFVLASSIELFEMPDDLLAEVKDKSTWARRGLAVQNTVIEPGWRGYLTLEISNHSEMWVKIPPGSPIAQVLFHQLVEPTEAPYRGKYNNQEDRPVAARFERGLNDDGGGYDR